MNCTNARRVGTGMMAAVALAGCARPGHAASESDAIRSAQPAQSSAAHVGCGQTLTATDVGVSIALTPATAGRWKVLLHNRSAKAVEFAPAHMDLVAVDEHERIISWAAAWAGLRYQSLPAGGEWSSTVTPMLTNCAAASGAGVGTTLPKGIYSFRLVTDLKGVTVSSAPVRVAVNADGTTRPA